jgi:hypothetical protein
MFWFELGTLSCSIILNSIRATASKYKKALGRSYKYKIGLKNIFNRRYKYKTGLKNVFNRRCEHKIGLKNDFSHKKMRGRGCGLYASIGERVAF